jgi:hypothetical protein
MMATWEQFWVVFSYFHLAIDISDQIGKISTRTYFFIFYLLSNTFCPAATLLAVGFFLNVRVFETS